MPSIAQLIQKNLTPEQQLAVFYTSDQVPEPAESKTDRPDEIPGL
jgi:hypothetical protein